LSRLQLATNLQTHRGEEVVKVGDLVKLRRIQTARNTGNGVGLIVQHQGEPKGWEDCYYKVLWGGQGPWYTWEDVCNLETIK
jgi:hypothetical protein